MGEHRPEVWILDDWSPLMLMDTVVVGKRKSPKTIKKLQAESVRVVSWLSLARESVRGTGHV